MKENVIEIGILYLGKLLMKSEGRYYNIYNFVKFIYYIFFMKKISWGCYLMNEKGI